MQLTRAMLIDFKELKFAVEGNPNNICDKHLTECRSLLVHLIKM